VKLYISRVSQAETGNTIVRRSNLMVDATLENSDATENEISLSWILHVPRIVNVKNVHVMQSA
jgi:hypothetical protein